MFTKNCDRLLAGEIAGRFLAIELGPAALVWLEALTVHGKLDEPALPALEIAADACRDRSQIASLGARGYRASLNLDWSGNANDRPQQISQVA